jgi:hypothetical protein
MKGENFKMTSLFKKDKNANTEKNGADQYLRHIFDLPSPLPIGLSQCDYLSLHPGPSISRAYDTGVKRHTLIFTRDPDELLAGGCAAGIDDVDLCRHISSAVSFQGFIGFVQKNLDGSKVAVTVQGAFLLGVPEATADDVGKSVYCSGPNSFSLSSRSAYEVGKILYLEKPGRAMTVFLKFNSGQKMVLDYQQKTAKFV